MTAIESELGIDRDRPFKASIIEQLIWRQFFSKASADGVHANTYKSFINIPSPVLAAVATAVSIQLISFLAN